MTSTQIPGSESVQFAGGFVAMPNSSFTATTSSAAYAGTSSNPVVISDSSAAGSVSQLSWSLGRVNGGTGTITEALLIDERDASTKLQARLYLFTSTVAPSTDGAAFAPTAAEMANIVGTVDFTSPIASSVSVLYHEKNVNMDFVCAATVQTIRGVLTAISSYSKSTAGESFQVILKARLD